MDTGFRNKITKCLFHNRGYCKYGESCRKQHFKQVCEQKSCNKDCKKRHPKPCKWGIKCKFQKNNICAFSHTTTIQKDSRIELFEKEVKALKDEIKALKSQNKILEEKFLEISKEQTKCAKSSGTPLVKEQIIPNNSKCDMCNKIFVTEINLK